MNTPTPDYGEPWSIQEGHLSTSLFDGEGVYFADIHELVGEDSSVAWAKAGRIIACVNACSKMADPEKEIAAMREVLREAHTSLNLCSSIIGAPFDTEWKSVEECDAAYGSAKSTLAKLQPFIK